MKQAVSIQWTGLLDWINKKFPYLDYTGLDYWAHSCFKKYNIMCLIQLEAANCYTTWSDHVAHFHVFENHLVGSVIMRLKVTLKRHHLAMLLEHLATLKNWEGLGTTL